MIRINLIGRKVRAKAKAPKGQLFIYLALLLVEVAFIGVWYLKLSSELDDSTRRAKDAFTKIEDLKKVKEMWEKWQAEKADIDKQAQVFERLRADQLGPPAMLQFLSYLLTKVPDTPVTADEIKAQELAGWNPKWDPRRVWIKRFNEKDNLVTLEGEAIDHEDVAEFYRRLEASGYFIQVAPGLQARKVHGELTVKMVDFAATAQLNYRVEAEHPIAAPADSTQAPGAGGPATPEGAAVPGGPGGATPPAGAETGAPAGPGGPSGPGTPGGPDAAGGPGTPAVPATAPTEGPAGGAAPAAPQGPGAPSGPAAPGTPAAPAGGPGG